MEDVLDLYEEPYDPKRTVVCSDETSKQLPMSKRPSIPIEPGHPERHDYEYEHNGTCSLIMSLEPLRGWRHVEITKPRRVQDFVNNMKWQVDEAYSGTGVVRWASTTWTPVKLVRCIRPSHPPRPDGLPSDWSSTIRPSVVVDSIWPRLNLASSVGNVLNVEFQMSNPSKEGLLIPRPDEIELRPPSTGSLLHATLGSS